MKFKLFTLYTIAVFVAGISFEHAFAKPKTVEKMVAVEYHHIKPVEKAVMLAALPQGKRSAAMVLKEVAFSKAIPASALRR